MTAHAALTITLLPQRPDPPPGTRHQPSSSPFALRHTRTTHKGPTPSVSLRILLPDDFPNSTGADNASRGREQESRYELSEYTRP